MNGYAVICVDDERMIIDSLKRSLNEALDNNFLVEIAEGGEDALELLQELIEDGYEIPLVITDYIMPGMKGDELLQQVHKISPGTLKIMLTGQASLDAVVSAINNARLYRYIAKPWQPSDLQLTVREAVRSYCQSRELEALNQAYGRFVPKQFLNLLGKQSILDIDLGSQIEREMTVLFADIRGFTALSENMSPQDNFNFINGYLSRMQPVISKHNGFIDKYIGDAIMALFPDSADDAVQAAVEMLNTLQEYNATRQRPERPPLRIGVGINTGVLMLGTVGAEERMEGTVIADAVNVAARVESVTKTYAADLLITESTYSALADPQDYNIRMVDRITVKGKSQAVTLYEVFDTEPDNIKALKEKTQEDLEHGMQLFQNENFSKAQAYFETVLAVYPDDQVAAVYLEHCRQAQRLLEHETPSILVVDDTPTNIVLLTAILNKKGYRVLVANNGKDALHMAEKNLPDLLLLDIMMPDMDGYEVCRQLKGHSETKDIPVIFVTALSDMTNKIKGFEVGGVDYLIKPFQAQEVLARVKTHLTLRHLHRQLENRNIELEINNLALKEKVAQAAKIYLP